MNAYCVFIDILHRIPFIYLLETGCIRKVIFITVSLDSDHTELKCTCHKHQMKIKLSHTVCALQMKGKMVWVQMQTPKAASVVQQFIWEGIYKAYKDTRSLRCSGTTSIITNCIKRLAMGSWLQKSVSHLSSVRKARPGERWTVQ